jgi:hypothetical protein
VYKAILVPLDAILDVAQSEAIDVIALSTHGWSGVPQALMGRVSAGLVANTHVPLLIGRPAALHFPFQLDRDRINGKEQPPREELTAAIGR